MKFKTIFLSIFLMSFPLLGGCDNSGESFDTSFRKSWKSSFVSSCIKGEASNLKSAFCNCIANKAIESLSLDQLADSSSVEKIAPQCLF